MFTEAAKEKLKDYLETHKLSKGVGDKESCCSIAAINLALTGRITDTIPNCMSKVIGQWIIIVQDGVPPEYCRENLEWLRLLPEAAGTGREKERERSSIVMDWMWSVLEDLQSYADSKGFGSEWKVMCSEHTVEAAQSAALAADAIAVNTYYVSDAAVYAADALDANAAAVAALDANAAAAAVAARAVLAASFDLSEEMWGRHSVVKLLRKLIN